MTGRPHPGRDHLRASIARLLAARRASSSFPRKREPPADPLDLQPRNAFEIAVAEQLKAMRREIDQLTNRVNWLLTLIVGAAVTNIVIALIR